MHRVYLDMLILTGANLGTTLFKSPSHLIFVPGTELIWEALDLFSLGMLKSPVFGVLGFPVKITALSRNRSFVECLWSGYLSLPLL